MSTFAKPVFFRTEYEVNKPGLLKSEEKKHADSGKDGKREIFLIHPIAQIEKVLSEEDDIEAIE